MVLTLWSSCLRSSRPTARLAKGSKRLAAHQAGSVLLEHPIIVVRDEGAVDLIGPPDARSHLRPIVRGIPKNETDLQRRFRQAADATQEWNQAFWAAHNGSFLLVGMADAEFRGLTGGFLQKKAQFVKERTCEAKPQLNADEMSEFYREFLNANWQNHVKYNFEWYRRNFALLGLALRVSLEGRFRLKYMTNSC
ncbi:cytochrome c oxidase assembly factor 8 isoform X1 [Dendroctonus ponderosae]|uniref:cytochrome c oxidase assembly factor 8 isoform X1 n=1 Tax=Dendroctonus ponderosae TaxID=77166 RepID=UPI0020358CE8|nr:cytochrome c oxidase assembly factor 8 isoform X1 [Dendroctonus ponderosae]